MKRIEFVILLIFLAAFNGVAQEVCDNGIDDDLDGLIDLNDTDCDCNNLIDLSLIPNPSFEDTLCCPDSEAQLNCAANWIQASGATTDYFNSCGLSELGFDGAVPPELPLPGGGDGFVGLYNFLGGYREYAGTCTTDPLLAGVSYSLNFRTAYAYGDADFLDLQLYGSPVCDDLPWLGVGCPEGIGSWELLGAEFITYVTDGTWQSVTITFTPLVNINTIAFGGPCDEILGSDGSYFYFDELILIETETMGYISQTGGWCSDDLVLTATTDDPGGTWQWYKDGIALDGEDDADLEPIPYGEGEFTAVYFYASGCKQINYHSPNVPTADFTHENVCFGEPINFINTSDLDTGIENFQWSFGDGASDTETNPVHYYTSAGLYDAELIVYSEDESCNDTLMESVTVFANPEPDFELDGIGVAFTGTDWLVCANHELNFNDLTTIDGAVSIATWNWKFGTETTSDLQYPVYSFDSSGTYEVKLVVEAENGCTDSIAYEMIVAEINAVFSTDTVCELNPVTFVDISTVDGGGPVVVWNWNFGDDSEPVMISAPTYTYETAGVYNATLFVENVQGCQDSVIQPVTVIATPEPNFYASENPIDYFNTALTLVIVSPNLTYNYNWDMPGAEPSSSNAAPSVEVVYPTFVAGDYEVVLTAISSFGCEGETAVTIKVLEDEMIYAPNSFTPNGDPINPDWGVFVEGFELSEFSLTLFNRWGEIIWQTQDPSQRWDGTYQNGALVRDGVYAWYVTARDQINDQVFEYNGTVTVIK